jgi:hypothetical protein
MNEKSSPAIFALAGAVVGAVLIALLLRSPATSQPPAPVVRAAPYVASCPWCHNPITIDPSRRPDGGQAQGELVIEKAAK